MFLRNPQTEVLSFFICFMNFKPFSWGVFWSDLSINKVKCQKNISWLEAPPAARMIFADLTSEKCRVNVNSFTPPACESAWACRQLPVQPLRRPHEYLMALFYREVLHKCVFVRLRRVKTWAEHRDGRRRWRPEKLAEENISETNSTFQKVFGSCEDKSKCLHFDNRMNILLLSMGQIQEHAHFVGPLLYSLFYDLLEKTCNWLVLKPVNRGRAGAYGHQPTGGQLGRLHAICR